MKCIFLENGVNYLSEEELRNLTNCLKEINIEVKVSKEEENVIKHSFFSDVVIYVNANLTELFVTGMLSPTSFEILKASFLLLYKRIVKRVRVLHNGNVRESRPVFKYKTEKGEVSVQIPNDLNDIQFELLMDNIKYGMESLAPYHDSDKLDGFMILDVKDDLNVQVKTLHEYVLEQKERQSCKKERNY